MNQLNKVFALAFLFCAALSSAAVTADEKDNKAFLSDTIEKFKSNCKGKVGIDYLDCWADHSPGRCKSLVYGKDRTAWTRCVYSCGSAGIFSRTVGECSD